MNNTKTRTQHTVLNAFWGLLSKLFYILVPFLIRTFLIKYIGIDYLGIGSLFTSILTILNLSELGIGTAIVFYMYKPIAFGEDDKVCAYLNTYKKIYAIVGLIILFVGLIITPFIKFFINGDIPASINIYFVFVLYLLNTCVSYFLFSYKTSLLYALQRNDVTSKISLFVHIIIYTLQILSIVLFKNYYLYVIWLPISSIVVNLITALISKRMYPKFVCKGHLNEGDKRDLKDRIIGLSVLKLSYASRNAFDSIVVSTFLGLTTVAMYNNYYYLINAVSGLLMVLVSSMTASLGNSIVVDSVDENENKYHSINSIFLFIVGCCFCCFLNLFQPFMRFWVGEDFLFPNSTMFLFSLYFLFEKSESISSTYFDITGLWGKGKWRGIIEASFNLFFNLLLCYLFNVNGIICATILSILLIGYPLTVFYIYKHYFKKSWKREVFHQYLNLILIVLIGFLTYLVCLNIPFGESTIYIILFLLLRLIISILLYLICYCLVFGMTKHFRFNLKWLKSHFLRR